MNSLTNLDVFPRLIVACSLATNYYESFLLNKECSQPNVMNHAQKVSRCADPQCQVNDFDAFTSVHLRYGGL